MLVLFVDDDSEDCDLFFDAVSEIDPDIKCLRAIDGEDAQIFNGTSFCFTQLR